MDYDDLMKRFTYHPPNSQEKVDAYQGLRAEARVMAQLIDRDCPDGREKSLAITKLEEVVMWANAAIARSE